MVHVRRLNRWDRRIAARLRHLQLTLGVFWDDWMRRLTTHRWRLTSWLHFRSLNPAYRVSLIGLILLAPVAVFGLTSAMTKSDSSARTWHYQIQLTDLLSPPLPQPSNQFYRPPVHPPVALPTPTAVKENSVAALSSPVGVALQAHSRNDSRNALPPARAAKTPARAAKTIKGDYQLMQKVQLGESLSSLLGQHQVDSAEIYQLSTLPKIGSYLRNLQIDHKLKLFFYSDDRLKGLDYQIDDRRYVSIRRKDNKFVGSLAEYPSESRLVYTAGAIKSSFFFSGRRAGLTDKTIIELSRIFAWDIDFARDLRPGDKFEILYENNYADNKFIGSGRILRARFNIRNRWLDAVRFEHDDRVEYYTPNGSNLRKAFMRNPLNVVVISSKFSRSRLHPILKIWKPHNGVDYAAPTNTPVRSTGYGTVKFRGVKGGYGNTVVISHGSRYQTLYAHLNRFAKSARVGSKVKQGQVIGYVGSTGRSTGPHLHYEFLINGKHTDPQKVKLPPVKPLAGKSMKLFTRNLSELSRLLQTNRARFAVREGLFDQQNGQLQSSFQP